MDNALCLEWNAGLQFAILVALDSKAAVKGQAKPSRLQPSHEKKERQLVIGWVAHEDGNRWRRWSSEFPRHVVCARTDDEMERRLLING